MKNERNHEMNLIKFLAVVLVILIHDKFPGTAGETVKGIAAAAVPIFFMISGYYSYGADSRRIYAKTGRTLKLVLAANALYLVWDICVVFLKGDSILQWFRESCTIKRFIIWIAMNESPFRGHLWFLGALLYAYFLLLLLLYMEEKGLLRLTEKRKNQWLFYGSCVLLFFNIMGGEALTQFGLDKQIPYIRNWLFCGLPFFFLAYLIHAHEEKILEICKKVNLWLCLFFALCLNLLEVILTHACELYFSTIGVVIVFFILALQRRGATQKKVALILGEIADRYGLWIFILQIIVIKNIEWFSKENGWEEEKLMQWGSPLLVFFITLLLAVLVTEGNRLLKGKEKRSGKQRKR